MAKEEQKTEGTVQPLEKAKEVAAEVAEKARQTYGATRDKLQAVGSEVGKRYDKLSDDVRRGAERASTVAKQRYDETSETLKKGYTKVRKDLDGLMKDVNAYVRDNPGKSVLMAAGAGFLLGLLFRGRRGDDE
jgi:ElaB/YqjD/DUF883 family membrane-anchored ribosome-binding protein